MSLATTNIRFTEFDDEQSAFGRNSVLSRPSIPMFLQSIFRDLLRDIVYIETLGTVAILLRGQQAENFTQNIFSPPTSHTPRVLEEIIKELDNLTKELNEGVIPSDELSLDAIYHAKEFLEHFYYLLKEFKLELKTPHLAIEDESVSFDWWNDPKTLAFFVSSEGAINYLKAWGPHMWDEMADGRNPSSEELIDLWIWLIE